MNVEQIIKTELERIVKENGQSANANLSRDTPVFETGLDSLGFAILVAQLEESLGFDPFAELESPLYPQTLGDFIEVYERHQQLISK